MNPTHRKGLTIEQNAFQKNAPETGQELRKRKTVRIIFRLTPEANDFLRGTNLAKRGLLTARLAEAIESVDLQRVEVVNLRTHWTRTTLDQTAVSIEDRHKELLRSEAKRRECSVNALVNAILKSYRSERGSMGWKDDWGANSNSF